jgi:septal ring factor EnvC (AmiA/AmiB activator)
MTKETIAIIFLLIFSIPTVCLIFAKKLEVKAAVTVLMFALLGAFGIANYDVIQKVKWGAIEVETAKQEITRFKENAIEDIKKEISQQKDSIILLISNVNDTREKVEHQRESLTDLVRTASNLQKKIEEQKNAIQALNQEGLKTKAEIQKLNNASAEIALILVRATYLTLETKNEFGTDRAQKALVLIYNDLNKILPMVIPDGNERSKWTQDLKDSLPERKP